MQVLSGPPFLTLAPAHEFDNDRRRETGEIPSAPFVAWWGAAEVSLELQREMGYPSQVSGPSQQERAHA